MESCRTRLAALHFLKPNYWETTQHVQGHHQQLEFTQQSSLSICKGGGILIPIEGGNGDSDQEAKSTSSFFPSALPGCSAFVWVFSRRGAHSA